MPMLLLLAMAGFAPAQSAPANPALHDKPMCNHARSTAADRDGSVRVKPLSQEPPADQYVAVLRTVDGCEKPIIVREDVGK
ncbi:hypothetical protein [Stakelama marina]|uniref:Uncharacterized protein n=1 Tax=Stakelama marina TaxID=2826939 RepID=A0A8T4IFI3_9SPHN|nr:hypothetical protein [Stakelama marina]MBR0552624.1 hypothetical protein [Stakelama marina]